MENRAFFYVDGIPTKGMWIDIDEYTDWDTVKWALMEADIIPMDEDGDPDFDGDILVADAEGIPKQALSQYDTIDLDLCNELIELEDDYDTEVIIAACECFGAEYAADAVRNQYQGQFDSDKDFAYSYVEDTGMLSEVDETVARYFDYESFARDLMFDFSEHNGHYFSDC